MEQEINQDITARDNGPSAPSVESKADRTRRGVSGSTLKMIAVVTMLIDHFAAGVLGRYLAMNGIGSLDINNMAGIDQWMNQNAALYSTYNIMRMIGRVAFPIYCFLLVEGFEHTRNRVKYAARLLLFAVISEVPFDLVFSGEILEFGYQNVFFTLFFGLLAMMGLRYIEEREDLQMMIKPLWNFVVIAACMFAAQFAQTDYAAIGVLCITVLYLFRKKKKYQTIAGCVAFLWELTAPLAFIPIWFYNGKRGWNIKYFFYLFYPVHLLLLYLLCMALGVDSYPSM